MIGDLLANGYIQVYNQLFELITSFKAHSNYISRIKQLPSGYVATVSGDFTCKLWRPSDWSLIQTYTGHLSNLVGMEYINNDTMATSDQNGLIHIWSISTNLNILIINNNSSMSVNCLKLLSNGIDLAAGLKNGQINIYNRITGSLITILAGHSQQVQDLVLMDSGKLLASSGDDNMVRIWNLTSFGIKHVLIGHTFYVRGLKLISTDILASSSYDTNIKLWNITDGSLIRTLTNHTSYMWWSLDILNDGQTLVSASGDKTIKFWNWTSGEVLNTINTNLEIRSLAVINAISEFIFFK